MKRDKPDAGDRPDIVDLRSDTVTKPTLEMRAAMMAAEVGDDVYGEDPTVNALEQEVAAILGKEVAVFTPSGTMANQIAILLHTRPGDSVICEEGSHVFINEAGAAAALAGVQFDLVPLADRMSDAAIAARYRAQELHAAPSSLLVVENTHNRAAGRVLSKRETGRIVAKARAPRGRPPSCGGARGRPAGAWHIGARCQRGNSRSAHQHGLLAHGRRRWRRAHRDARAPQCAHAPRGRWVGASRDAPRNHGPRHRSNPRGRARLCAVSFYEAIGSRRYTQINTDNPNRTTLLPRDSLRVHPRLSAVPVRCAT